MRCSPLAASVVSALSAAALALSCNASVTEGCLDGPCAPFGTGGASSSATASQSASQSASTATGTGGTGTGGSPGADACPPTPQTGDFPCDVFAVIHANCNPCHQSPPLNGAPFPLLTYADTQQIFEPGKLRFQQMYDQTRPGAIPQMPLGGTLGAHDFTTLSDWLVMCAPPVPSGTGCGCPGTGCD